MGLAGRKEKQRIPNDPRNLAWSENAAKFGHTYLAKLGWNPELGLGVAKDGRTTNITVAQKLDQLGIGAGRGPGGNDKDAIAWKQQNDFEMMLARLNTPDGETPPPAKTGVVAALGFVSGNGDDTAAQAQNTPDAEVAALDSKPKKDKKRKRSQVEGQDETSSSSPADVPSAVSAVTEVPTAPAPRRFAHHRARLLHSKKIKGKDASHISEILGVAPSASSSSSASPAPGGTPGTLTPISDEKITTSTTSISDYFKEKMEKMKNKHKWMAEGASSEPVLPPMATTSRRDDEEDDERPRFGLGARRVDSLLSVPPSFAPSTSASTSASPFPSFAPSANSSSAPLPPAITEDAPLASSSSYKLIPSPPDTNEVLDKAERRRRRKEAKAAAIAAAAAEVAEVPPAGEVTESALLEAKPSEDGKKKKKRKVDKSAVEDTTEAETEAKRKRKEEKRAKKRTKEELS